LANDEGKEGRFTGDSKSYHFYWDYCNLLFSILEQNMLLSPLLRPLLLSVHIRGWEHVLGFGTDGWRPGILRRRVKDITHGSRCSPDQTLEKHLGLKKDGILKKSIFEGCGYVGREAGGDGL
jgi:hypothetical protein